MDLRPLAIGELFDRAFVLYRRHFWLFVGITAVPGVFALALTLIQSGIQNPAMQGIDPDSPEFEAAALQMLWPIAGVMVVAVLYFIVYMVALGATTLAVSEVYMGRTATIAQVYGRMKGRVGALLWLLFLVSVRMCAIWMVAIIFIGMAAVVSPVLGALTMLAAVGAAGLLSLFLMLRYGVAVPALVLEGRTARSAIRRSIELTRGRLGRVFLLVVCALMVTYATLMLFQGPFVGMAMYLGVDTWPGFWLNIAGAVLGTIGTTVTSPFMIIGLALIYYDARIRDEGFDLEVMLAALDGAAAPARA